MKNDTTCFVVDYIIQCAIIFVKQALITWKEKNEQNEVNSFDIRVVLLESLEVCHHWLCCYLKNSLDPFCLSSWYFDVVVVILA